MSSEPTDWPINPTAHPLENDHGNVIAKAMNGHGITPEMLAEQCKLPIKKIHHALDAKNHPADTSTLTSIAIALNLRPSALTGLSSFKPMTNRPPELTHIVTPFGHAGANVFIVKLGGHTILFDAGTSSAPITDYLKKENLTLDAIYITHAHHDHVGGLTTFPDTPTFFPDDLPHGTIKTLSSGITLTSLETSGHFTPSRAYVISGLSQKICICGDILFSGSMGKTASPDLYRQSLRHLREHIMSLQKDTLICPGHGPITTVEQEAKSNPFL